MATVRLLEVGRKRLYVSRPTIKSNAAEGKNLPVWRCKHGSKTYHCESFVIEGAAKSHYSQTGHKICGVSAWLETRFSVTLYGVPNEQA
jgi:hypothetical protein